MNGERPVLTLGLKNAIDVLVGAGDHADHQREQVGRCVHCSCGARVQGTMRGPA